MKLTLPSNWDDRLIDGLNPDFIDHLYGQANSDEYGGGRPSVFLPETSSERISEHIRKVRAAGIGFNYVINASCFENRSFDSQFVQRFRRYIDFLCGCGITSLTLSDRFLIKLARKYYPHLKISTSIFAIITNISQAKQYEDMGVTDIILGNPNDREFISAVRRAVSCNLVLFANLGCHIFCSECSLHSYSATHSSQKNHHSGGFYVEHHVLRCLYKKIESPESILKTMYVRPEDMWLYEMHGIDKLKIVDRLYPTDVLHTLVKMYAAGSHNGNFLDIVNALSMINNPTVNVPDLKKILSPLKINVAKLIYRAMSLSPFSITIDNRALDGMKKEIFESGVKCWSVNCAKCGICHKYFIRAAKYYGASQDKALRAVKKFIDSFSSSDLFKWTPF